MRDYQTKQSLVHDLQEPFRWLIDLTVMEAFEPGSLDVPHFHFTGDDYRYRFDVEAKTRFLNLLREQFNSGINYNGRVLKWDTVIEQKATELSRFLSGKSREIDFTEPSPNLERSDSLEIRKAILCLTQDEAKKSGIRVSNLHPETYTLLDIDYKSGIGLPSANRLNRNSLTSTPLTSPFMISSDMTLPVLGENLNP